MRVDIVHQSESLLPRWNHDGLARPYWRLYRNAEPGWSIRHRGQTTALVPDRVILIAPETVYVGIGRTPCRHLWIHATGDGLMGGATPGIFSLDGDAVAMPLCSAVNATEESAGRRMLAVALLLVAVSRVADRIGQSPRRSASVAAAMALAERHLHRRLDNTELARAAGMQRNSFVRRFHTEVGLTPQHWHQGRRIKAACLALERGDATIDDIAAGYGFCDRHHFTRVFTRLRGIAPAAYRRSAGTG